MQDITSGEYIFPIKSVDFDEVQITLWCAPCIVCTE